MANNVVVVGGGLAGLTAAAEALEKGCNVIILDKKSNLGGQSSKATCGIAAPGCSLQQADGVQDTGSDLVAEGPDAKALVTTGTKDVEWLVEAVGVKSELILRLTPGHGKVRRTLGTNEHFPGSVITYAIIHQMEEIAKAKPNRLKIQAGADVTKITTSGAKVTGVEYADESGNIQTVLGEVIIATGGFAGDNSPSSVLAKFAPKLLALPSTGDGRNNGDGIRLGEAVGAATDKMGDISLSATAAVIPGFENDNFKMVMSEAICGAGGKMIDAAGTLFVDALASSQIRTDAMQKGKGPFRLVVPELASESVKWLTNFYVSRKIMKRYSGAAELAQEMRVPVGNLKDIGTGPLLAAVITPALYSCCGGLSAKAGRVISTKGAAIEGLYVAGEACAVPYPKIFKLSGIPMLHCVFTGRMAGAAAAATLKPSQGAMSLSKIASAVESKAEAKKPEDMTKDELIKYVKDLEAGGAAPAKGAAPAPPADPGVSEAELAKHTSKTDGWVVLFGEVYDVTKWLPVHPGGEQAIMAYLGKDATEEWKMIHKAGTIEKNMQFLTKKGKFGNSPAPFGNSASAADGMPVSEVAKHNTKQDAWIILFNEAIDVTKWIPVHPGGEAAIMSYLGKDATEEWKMIHKAGTIEKNMQHLKKMGKVQGDSGGGAQVQEVDPDPDPDPISGNGGIPGPLGAVVYLLKTVLVLTARTVLFTGNFKISLDNNRKGTIRSAIMLLLFTIVHVGGNFIGMLVGPDEANGEGYFFDRVRWTGGPFREYASGLEVYVALALVLHVSVALKRSWDISINYTIGTGRWNMLLSGLTVLVFLTKHLADLRFYPNFKYVEIWVPKYYVAFPGLLYGRVFAELPGDGIKVKARDLYTREAELFSDINTNLLYTACILVFVAHMCMGWKKLVPSDAMQIPKSHVSKVTYMGWILAISIGSAYLSVLWFAYFSTPLQLEHVPPPTA